MTSEAKKNQPVVTIEYENKIIYLLGTAHISKDSVVATKDMIEEKKPDCVAVELDLARQKTLQDKAGYKNLDIIAVLKKNQGFLLLANLILAGIQKRMGQNLGMKPGDEMIAALDIAKEKNIDVALVDRPVETTLLRAWCKTPVFARLQLVSNLMAGCFSKQTVSEQEVEAMKQKNEMDSMMQELSCQMPKVKEVLIDERDSYLAKKILCASKTHNTTLAVLGAGHLLGVQDRIQKLLSKEIDIDIESLSSVPKKSFAKKFFMWLVPIFLICLIIAGFVVGGYQMGKSMIGSWVLWNGLLAGLACLFALPHPLSFLASVIGAPFTSLCPFIGVGMVSGFVQAVVAKPKVKDLETLLDDATSPKGFFQNRILKVLLVFFFSSIGSSIGTFVAGASFLTAISSVFDKMLKMIGLM